MSNHLDDRIRDLYAELMEAAPAVPPLPDPGVVRSRRVPTWPALAAMASATAVVVLLVGALIAGRQFGTSDEAADTTAAVTTTAVAAETTTTVAAETTAPPTTAPALIDALDTACRDFAAFAGAEFPAELTTLDEYQKVWGGVAVFSSTIDAIAGDAFRSELTDLNVALAGGPGADLSLAAGRRNALVLALDALSLALDEAGADDCDLAGVIPPSAP